jgi:hypothetical protein
MASSPSDRPDRAAGEAEVNTNEAAGDPARLPSFQLKMMPIEISDDVEATHPVGPIVPLGKARGRSSSTGLPAAGIAERLFGDSQLMARCVSFDA